MDDILQIQFEIDFSLVIPIFKESYLLNLTFLLYRNQIHQIFNTLLLNFQEFLFDLSKLQLVFKFLHFF